MLSILAHCILLQESEFVVWLLFSKINHYQPKIDPWFYTGTVWSVKLAAVDALVAISTRNTLLILLKVGILLKGPNVP